MWISSRHRALALLALISSLPAPPCLAGNIHQTFPQEIIPDARYVFYSHGYIVEGNNPKPRHPDWGTYDFPAIKRKLAGFDIELIAFHRPENTNPFQYSKSLAEQVEQLLSAGVRANRITLLGFSLGGQITAFADWRVNNAGINVIIMAGCGDWVEEANAVQLNGRFLSIIEVSDSAGSCQALADRSPGLITFKEIEINTGKEHGAFYKPRKEWLVPVMAWIE
jgi:hypothetical protein